MSQNKHNQSEQTELKIDNGRREFLRKSAYAAYATPVIMSLLIEKASANSSIKTGNGNYYGNDSLEMNSHDSNNGHNTL